MPKHVYSIPPSDRQMVTGRRFGFTDVLQVVGQNALTIDGPSTTHTFGIACLEHLQCFFHWMWGCFCMLITLWNIFGTLSERFLDPAQFGIGANSSFSL